MGRQNCRQQQYALDLADKCWRRSAPRAHNLIEVSPPRIGIVSPLEDEDGDDEACAHEDEEGEASLSQDSFNKEVHVTKSVLEIYFVCSHLTKDYSYSNGNASFDKILVGSF